MLLTSLDGASLELRPTGYEFAQPTRGSNWGDDEWDPNWLVVHGVVRTAQGDVWSFDDPCLTTWEARELAVWLRDAAEGRVVAADAPTEDSPGLLGFVEPNLGFSIARVDDSAVVVRAHLSAEAVTDRPGEGPDQWALYAYSVPLTLGRDDLLAAARVWEEELSPFPKR